MAGPHLEGRCGRMASTAVPIPPQPHAQGKPGRPPSRATRLNDVKITARVRFRPEFIASLYSDPPFSPLPPAPPPPTPPPPAPRLCLSGADDTDRSHIGDVQARVQRENCSICNLTVPMRILHPFYSRVVPNFSKAWLAQTALPFGHSPMAEPTLQAQDRVL